MENSLPLIATKENIQKHLCQLKQIDKYYFKDESWENGNFLSESKDKFSTSLLFIQNDNLVGYIISSMKKSELYIHKYVITPQKKGKGYGKEMLAHFIKHNKPKSISLKVSITNTNAIIFYIKMGFSFVEKQSKYYLMFLQL